MRIAALIIITATMVATNSVTAEVKIGVLVPLSGTGARSQGQQVQASVLLAKQLHPASGISLVFEDSACDAKTAVTAAKKLIFTDKVIAIIGDVCWTDLIAPIAEQNRIPVISTGSAQSSVRTAGDYIFRLKLDVAVDSKALAETLRTRFDYARAAVLNVDDQWGEGISRNFNQAFAASGGSVAFSNSYQRDERDYRTLLLKVKRASPDVIMLAGYPENLGMIAKQLRALGITVPLAAYRGGMGTEALELGGAALEGIVFMEEFDAEGREESRRFAKEFTETYGYGPDLFGAMGYDAYTLFAQAIERCGADTACIKDGFYTVRDFPGVSGRLSFDSFGDVLKPMTLFKVAEGKFVPYR